MLFWFQVYSQDLALHIYLGLPGGSVGKNPLTMQETWVQSLGQEDLLEEEMAVFLPGKSHRQRSQAGYSPWGLKESDTTK